jgi:diaminopimelate epimerase
MEMYNADGSRGEMCGNGIRCVGKYLYDRGIIHKKLMRIETDAGVKILDLQISKGVVMAVTVDMGEPIFEGREIPVAADGRVVDAPLQVGGNLYTVTCVSMGNPHCVVFVEDLDCFDVAAWGPQFEQHPFFPKRVNTEFIQVMAPGHLKMRVWERGSGETWACGTGACAAAVAAAATGRAHRSVILELRGGKLAVEWREADNRVYLTGPAVEAFSGTVEV